MTCTLVNLCFFRIWVILNNNFALLNCAIFHLDVFFFLVTPSQHDKSQHELLTHLKHNCAAFFLISYDTSRWVVFSLCCFCYYRGRLHKSSVFIKWNIHFNTHTHTFLMEHMSNLSPVRMASLPQSHADALFVEECWTPSQRMTIFQL